ncbi:MAG: GNAT family N-acetyltransferase [Alphaproteobacteria bacterium]|nr:GNAT family N-acetyltransferase [Alphaproteobacteria bacterium]
MYALPLVPEGFDVPERLETDRLCLRPLTIHDAVKDFDAVMTSADRLRGIVFGPEDTWPDGLTLEQNLTELAWHQTEFRNRTSFAYTVVSLDESWVLGSVYLYPSRKAAHDVDVMLWVRQSEADTGLDDHLYVTVRDWLATAWPFARPAFPGRAIDWETWADLAAK